MTVVVECTHPTIKLLNVHIQWPLAIECVDLMAKMLNVIHSNAIHYLILNHI